MDESYLICRHALVDELRTDLLVHAERCVASQDFVHGDDLPIVVIIKGGFWSGFLSLFSFGGGKVAEYQLSALASIPSLPDAVYVFHAGIHLTANEVIRVRIDQSEI